MTPVREEEGTEQTGLMKQDYGRIGAGGGGLDCGLTRLIFFFFFFFFGCIVAILR